MSTASKHSPKIYTKTDFFISTDPQLLDFSTVYQYLSEQSYWARGRSRKLVELSIKKSVCFGVYKGIAGSPVQVGFARVISDFATFAYLADVFILPEYQSQGLGKWLVSTILNYPELQLVGRWALFTKDAQDLYRQFGFDIEQDPQMFMSYRPHRPKNRTPDQLLPKPTE
jgi:GNAT superfamily N-acetyltransferase